MGTKIRNLTIYPILENCKFWGVTNSTPLKMNLVLEIRLMLTPTTAGMLFLDPLLFYK